MSAHAPRTRRRVRLLRLAALMVVFGLLVEIISLAWSHPTAFLAFLFGGGLFIAAGAFIALITLLRTGPDKPPEETLRPAP